MKTEEIAAYTKNRNLEIESPSHTVVRLTQRQDLDIEVEMAAGEPKCIAGALRNLHWDNLEEMAELLRQSLVQAGVYEPGQLSLQLSVIRQASKWSPSLEIILSTGRMTDKVKEKASMVVQLALTEITSPSGGQQARCDVDLDPQTVQAVQSCVAAALAVKGGRVIRAEISVDVAGEQIANVRGRLRPKPDRSNFAVVPVEMRGRLTGFELEREVLHFRQEGEGAIVINIGKLDLDLFELARLIISRTDARVRLHRTEDKCGVYKYAYVTLLQEQAC